jgi:type IV pilus assembly protein PilA
MRLQPKQDGFTLIEILIVVLILSILILIAIPTYLGLQRRANDRAAQSQVRNGITVAMVYFADGQEFTEEPELLEKIDSSLAYTKLPDTLVPGRNIYVDVPDPMQETVIMGAKSDSGTCWWMRATARDDKPRFAETKPCGTDAPAEPAFQDAW